MFLLIFLFFPYCVAEHLIDESTSAWAKCLKSNKRIIGGQIINITEAPYQLVLEVFNVHSFRWDFHCGAVIVANSAAATAGHCVAEYLAHPQNFRLRIGTSVRTKGKIHYVRRVVIHEKYNLYTQTLDSDIALLFVFELFKYSKKAQPVKLPTKEAEIGTEVAVTGWGISSVPQKKTSNIPVLNLHKVVVPIVDRKICAKVFQKHAEKVGNFPFKITANNICAGIPKGDKDSCQGDSGGPLVQDGTLYGIVSWGVGCAIQCLPGVYTNVANFALWIEETILKDRWNLAEASSHHRKKDRK